MKEQELRSSLLQQMDGAIKRCLDQADFVKYRNTSQHHPEGPLLFGEVVAAINDDRLQ
jgi:hypothetical protein